jgi:hypothetical protein
LDDMLTYAPMIVAIAVFWGTYAVTEAIDNARRRQHEDHEALISELGEMRQLLTEIEACTNGMARVIDPPPTVDEMIAQYEKTKT